MGKKKFIDKKKSAVFQLHARDTSDPNYGDGPGGDRVFVRVDTNPYENPIFDDANEDGGDENHVPNPVSNGSSSSSLPVGVRKEILELGLPDDGYNYLAHLREIKNTGAGTAYYQNTKAKLDEVPHDVKAYDASRVRVLDVGETEPSDDSIYKVAAKTVGVKVQRAVDEEIAALLADNDLSRFESDDEDLELEEDFVLKANLPEDGVEEAAEIVFDENINEQPEVIKREYVESGNLLHSAGVFDDADGDEDDEPQPDEKPRAPRFLDEQFDMLALKEYATDSDNDKEDVYEGSGYGDSESEEEVPLAAKLNNPFLDQEIEKLDFDMAYKVPADYVHGNEGLNNEKLKDSAADLIRRCAEYGQKFDDESHDKEDMVIWEESSEESEEFDCESVISTYTNLENHPGKIEAPVSTRRKKKLADALAAIPTNGAHVITLKGRENIAVDFLPRGKRDVAEKVTKVPGLKSELYKRKPHGGESKEEKKERKSAVKEERREARKAKKEMKVVYKSETQKAQKVAAVCGPSSIHLM